MKSCFLLMAALFMSHFASAQQGEIIYTDFEPNLTRTYFWATGWVNQPLSLDMDLDGADDFQFSGEYSGTHMFVWVFLKCVPSQEEGPWNFRLPYTLYDEDPYKPILGDTVHVGETIANIEESWYGSYRFHYYPLGVNGYLAEGEGVHYYISVRKEVDDGYCYGWIDVNLATTYDEGFQQFFLTVFRMAFCTIPNYPLRVGQTSFDWAIPENNESLFANLHPNPTTGLVTITGKDLKQAEVLNTLGQRVANATGESERITIDISSLPTGIYFVNVTDKEGRKCVRKVVKE